MNFRCYNIRSRLTECAACLLAALVCHGAGTSVSAAATANLRVEIISQLHGAPVDFDSVTHTTVSGQEVALTRLDFLVSNPAQRRNDGVWVGFSNGGLT